MVREGVRLALQSKFGNVTLELDSQIIVNCLANEESPSWKILCCQRYSIFNGQRISWEVFPAFVALGNAIKPQIVCCSRKKYEV